MAAPEIRVQRLEQPEGCDKAAFRRLFSAVLSHAM